ncbi:MAG: 2-succinyl-5-enolpyruvyl-6-hydroxy-3-cyclohexene-1-carboxylate synthase, partial [Anaerolineae bacterium]|nr:2-succinyl-5-enolpyruvyl-6-hydroxy-3-cyclohexene-1-carboxylate synthase [Anaerolineae bacterium]
MTAPNRSTLWAEIFVDELARAGLRHVCIAPGSRSTPLTIAFFQHADISVHSLLDERGAGFFALGMALAGRQPVAVVCTSGTAASNLHPAITEAYYAQIPLLILTTDRPHELRHSGSNQTID